MIPATVGDHDQLLVGLLLPRPWPASFPFRGPTEAHRLLERDGRAWRNS
jgi:hypothetical protein